MHSLLPHPSFLFPEFDRTAALPRWLLKKPKVCLFYPNQRNWMLKSKTWVYKSSMWVSYQETKSGQLIGKGMNFPLLPHLPPLTPSAGPPSSACKVRSRWDLLGSYIIHNKDLATRNDFTSLLMCKSLETAQLTFWDRYTCVHACMCVCIKLKKKRKHWNKLPEEVGDSRLKTGLDKHLSENTTMHLILSWSWGKGWMEMSGPLQPRDTAVILYIHICLALQVHVYFQSYCEKLLAPMVFSGCESCRLIIERSAVSWFH